MPFMWQRGARNTDVQDAKTADRGRVLDDHAFDDLARAIASRTTRRDSLKLLLVGMASAGLGAGLMENYSQGHAPSTRRGSNQVETLAIVTASCNIPFTTDPSCQAITLLNSRESCDGILQQGSAGDYNGCGSQKIHLSGNFPGGVNVTSCCNNHDCCYSTCDKPKSDCDSEFLACMMNVCAKVKNREKHKKCTEEAEIFYDAVNVAGGILYFDAQNAACKCCCPAGQTRCNGACVDTQNDPDNCGAGCVQCSTGQQCVQGTCVSAFGSDLILSPGTLTQTDNGEKFYTFQFDGGTQTFTITNTGTGTTPTLDLSLSLSPGLPSGLITLSNDKCSDTSLDTTESCTFEMGFPVPTTVCPGGSSMVFVQAGGEILIDLYTPPICPSL